MTSTAVLVPADSNAPPHVEHPLIDIDHTVWIQLALFLLVALIGSRLLFRPYLKMRDERTAGIEGARDEGARLSAEADARLAHYESQLQAARARAQDERRKVRAEAAAHQREAVERARAEAAAAFEQARARVVRETEAARAQLMPRASQIADELAAKLLGRRVS
ncbi:MAG TPA: ATP synthase F0 subunit B [Kofleriaceae bacterium]|nr:ATP synthase F0 subunit B [Kofleriaceae bacterium]